MSTYMCLHTCTIVHYCIVSDFTSHIAAIFQFQFYFSFALISFEGVVLQKPCFMMFAITLNEWNCGRKEARNHNSYILLHSAGEIVNIKINIMI